MKDKLEDMAKAKKKTDPLATAPKHSIADALRKAAKPNAKAPALVDAAEASGDVMPLSLLAEINGKLGREELLKRLKVCQGCLWATCYFLG